MSENLEFLDITNAITAVYLTSFRSVECICTENLVNNECEVKYVNFQNMGKLNVISDTKNARESDEKRMNSDNDLLVGWQREAYEHYLSLKHDENASLLL